MDDIAEEWIRMTFSNDPDVTGALIPFMMNSYATITNYMAPLGLHRMAAPQHHYGPAPWTDDQDRADMNSVYYHQADREGIGFDRTSKGSDALSQYSEQVRKKFATAESCPEELMLWFHHLNWDHPMKSGNTLWNELCYRYYAGADSVAAMQDIWNSLDGTIDSERHRQVNYLLKIQHNDER